MSQVLDVDVRQIVVEGESFGLKEAEQVRAAIARDFSNYRVLREAVQLLEQKDQGAPTVRLGICYYLLGRYTLAGTTLSEFASDGLGQFYLGRNYFAQERLADAQTAYERALAAGFDKNHGTLFLAETLRYRGQAEAALKMLDDLSGPIEQTAEYLYQRGATISAVHGNPDETVRLYERAVETDGRHPGALFGLAIENDRRGNDGLAIELYERSVNAFPPHVGALLNLGLMYEERNHYERARSCYRRILDVFPNHGRARLFFKDASASSEMLYDEEAQRKRDRLNQMLGIPVTDFELSVRSRNCLQGMGIMTLGDLTSITEQELLASKNFGETSLHEIREMLSTRGLTLGQFAGERGKFEPTYDSTALSPDEQQMLNRPIADLNLSVRARKCMVRLGISTIAELVRKTGDELLECKNFGVTSLNEVREKLTIQGLRLRGD